MPVGSRSSDRSRAGERRTWRPALLIFALALATRTAMFAVVANHPERMIRRDSRTYTSIASNLLDGHGYSRRSAEPYVPDALRTPVYPLFIAGVYGVLGRSAQGVAVVQILIDTLSCALIYAVGRRLFSERSAWWAAALYAISSVSIVHTVFILSEILFTLLILAAVAAAVMYRRSGFLRWGAAGGLLWGLATLCRPIGVFALPILGFALFVSRRDRPQRRLATVSLALLCGILVVAPWVVRNRAVTGYWTLSTVTDSNLLDCYGSAILADSTDPDEAAAREALVARATRELRALDADRDPWAWIPVYRRLGTELIAEHPVRFAYRHLLGDLNAFLPPVSDVLEALGVTAGAKGTLSVLNRNGPWAAAKHYLGDRTWLLLPMVPLMVVWGATLVLALAGGWALLRRRAGFEMSLLAGIAACLLVVPGTASVSRFAVPAVPCLALLAGVGVAGAGPRWPLRPGGPNDHA
jgi:4-amino-4-deoxy-L-arabinose transferase-like glycosyltransferase